MSIEKQNIINVINENTNKLQLLYIDLFNTSNKQVINKLINKVRT